MQAIRQREFGPAEVLVVEEVPDPRPGPGEVLLAVEAAGVHLLDTAIRSGVPGGPFPRPDLPMTPGREVAGAVVAVGSGVGEAWAGRRVVAHLGAASGGYAALALAPATALTAFTSGDVVRRSLTVSWIAGPRMLRHGLRPLETRALAEAAAGRLVPLVHPAFALADAPAAHRALEERSAVGKVVLHP